jgi:hypothetical protein
MAGDWIKMRVLLIRDPKVVSMADFLASERDFMNWLTNPVQQSCRESAFEHVTRNVICHVTVSALVTVWGVARERGDREGDDLVVKHCDLGNLDHIADVPCFGEAMQYVGWAAEEVLRDKVSSVRFPKFFRQEEPPAERHRDLNAERQRRYRQKKGQTGGVTQGQAKVETSNATGNVTVTPREEKRRVEKDTPPLPPLTGSLAALDTERFRGAWGDWLTHRKEKRKPVTATQAAKLLPQLAAEGEAAAVARIERAIANGYQGLIFPDEGRAANGARRGESFDDVIDRLSPKQEGGAP